MDHNLFEITLILLTFFVVLNFWLTIRLVDLINGLKVQQQKPFTLPSGAKVPAFDAIHLGSKQQLHSSDFKDQSFVLVFLSSKCSTCKEKLKELEQIASATEMAGIQLWIIGMESSRRHIKFLAKTPLLNYAVALSDGAKSTLNPKLASPYYLFIDHDGILQASNFIGDENWLSFLLQMQDVIKENEQS